MEPKDLPVDDSGRIAAGEKKGGEIEVVPERTKKNAVDTGRGADKTWGVSNNHLTNIGQVPTLVHGKGEVVPTNRNNFNNGADN